MTSLRKVAGNAENFDAVNFEDLGLCPCGMRIGANAQTCAVIHELPPCQAFTDLEADDFLAYVRKSRGIDEGRPN